MCRRRAAPGCGSTRCSTAAGWAVQDANAVNLAASRGVAVREFVMKRPHGRADYLLFLDGQAAGVVEAKKEGETLTGVEWQSAKYVDGLPDELEPAVEGGARRSSTSRPAPRRGSRTGSTPTRRAGRSSRSTGPRRSPAGSTSSAATRPRRRCATGCAQLPELLDDGACGRRRSRAIAQPRGVARGEPAAGADPDGDRLGQDVHRRERLATGWSSTPTRGAILFLVDRANLGRQTLKEFQGVHDARRRPQVHRALQRPAPELEQDRPGRAGRRSRRSSGSTRSCAATRSSTRRLDEHSAYELDRPSRCRSSTTRPSRPRRSTSSSSTSATARSTGSGGRCSTTSTPSRSG